jgi:hypothetical protein
MCIYVRDFFARVRVRVRTHTLGACDRYHVYLLLTREVIGVVCIGVLGNILVFMLLCMFTAVWQKLVSKTQWFSSIVVCACVAL